MRISMPPAGSLCVVQAGQSNGRGSAPIGKDNVLAPLKRNYMLTLGGHGQQPVFEPTGTTQRQYGGSLFEQAVLLTLDALCHALW